MLNSFIDYNSLVSTAKDSVLSIHFERISYKLFWLKKKKNLKVFFQAHTDIKNQHMNRNNGDHQNACCSQSKTPIMHCGMNKLWAELSLWFRLFLLFSFIFAVLWILVACFFDVQSWSVYRFYVTVVEIHTLILDVCVCLKKKLLFFFFYQNSL